MNDKDIKRLFNSAMGNFNSSDITPEEIREAVDNRIRYRKNDDVIKVLDSDGEAVQPIIVHSRKSKFGFMPGFLAGAAAFALTAAAIGIGINSAREKLSPFSTGTDISLETEAVSEITAKSEVTIEAPLSSGFLDNGTQVEFWGDGSIRFLWFHNEYRFYNFIEEENGKLVLKTLGDPVDITDKISKQQCYIIDRPANDDHIVQYIIVGGDAETGDYGYAIVFRHEDSSDWGIIAYTANPVPIMGLTPYYSSPDEVDMEATWLNTGIFTLKANYGETDIKFSEDRYFLIKKGDRYW